MIDLVSASLSNYGLVGQIGIAARSISSTEATLTEQTTSGLTSPNVTGLGEDTSRVLNLQSQIGSLTALSQNAALATSRLEITQSAVGSISSIAAKLATDLTALSAQEGSALPAAITALSGSAKNDLGALAAMLNAKSGDTYVFAGEDGSVAPVPDPSLLTSGALTASVASALSTLATAGAASTLSAAITAVGNNPVFASSLNVAPAPSPVTSEVGLDQSAIVGFPATTDLGMNGSSQTSTGSSVNDLIAVLTTVANLSSSDSADPQLMPLISGLRTTLAGSENGLQTITATLGSSQQQVTASGGIDYGMTSALTSQIGDLTSVDLPTVATQLTATQNQLMASYELIADLKSLSLAAYI